jgi:hypothetical protein
MATNWNEPTQLHPLRDPSCSDMGSGYPQLELPELELIRDEETKMDIFERALEIVKNIFVIVTCMAILFTLVRMYLWIQHLQEALHQLANTVGA